MSDISITFIVIICTAIIVALIFIFIRKVKVKNENIIKEECLNQGWILLEDNKPIHRKATITSDNWCLVYESKYRSSSSNWSHNVLWTSKQILRSEFILGNSSSTSNFENIPSLLRDILELQLLKEYGVGLDMLKQDALTPALRDKYLLFTNNKEATAEIVRNLEPQLLYLPKHISMLIIRSGESGVNIEISGINLNTIDKIKEIIQLGESISGL